MVVGVLSLELYIPEARTLKDKRSVVRRVVERVRNRFPVSVAEVGSLDLIQKATIGLAVVSNDNRLADSILNKARDFVEALYLAQVIASDLEILHV